MLLLTARTRFTLSFLP